ncbi:hypothetical protein [Oerskovia enterophila]|uniref:hypothetical protein n=1 Tax=Oerskovia enterophila TaxID=43678 RepID=UPI00339378F0
MSDQSRSAAPGSTLDRGFPAAPSVPAARSLAPLAAVLLVVLAVPLCLLPALRVLAVVPATVAVALAVVGMVQERRAAGGRQVLAVAAAVGGLVVLVVAVTLLVAGNGTTPARAGAGDEPSAGGTLDEQEPAPTPKGLPAVPPAATGETALVLGTGVVVPEYLALAAADPTGHLSDDGTRAEDTGLPVTITNLDEDEHVLALEIHALDAAGDVLLWGAATEVVVPPGESAQLQVFDFDKPSALAALERAVTFRVSSLYVDVEAPFAT